VFHLYIDTNVLLALYHFTTDELSELEKLRALLGQGKAKLYLPEQTRTEFKRNRDNKIADALKRLKDQKIALQFPQFCRDYPEYAELRQLEAEMQKKFASLITRATTDIEAIELQADKAIVHLFKSAHVIPTTADQVTRARLRMDLGNPPGKNNSLGDAINWEALLETVPSGADLVFISGDKDYVSPLKEDVFHSFLVDEWVRAKRSDIVFYKRLASFFKDHFPTSVLATDLERELLIKDLGDSASFATTHSVVARLDTYRDFNKAQRNAILDATLSNNQVHLIATDDDVHGFLTRVVAGHEAELDQAKLANVVRLLDGKSPVTLDVDDDLPF
jgi:hypothetical protein